MEVINNHYNIVNSPIGPLPQSSSNNNNNNSPQNVGGSEKKLRILCLHGYKQNGTIFKAKTAVLRKSLKDIAEFIYVDAPHIVDESKGTASWWRASKDGKEYRGWDKTLDYLKEVFVTQGPFDGVLGFSQGAVLCSLLCSISSLNSDPTLEINNIYHNCFSIKFGLLFSGFQSRATIHQSLYPCNTNSTTFTATSAEDMVDCNDEHPQQQQSPKQNYPLNKINTPSLHIYGKEDLMVSPSSCENLSLCFQKPNTYIHPYGHLIPTTKIDVQNYRNFITTFLKDCEL